MFAVEPEPKSVSPLSRWPGLLPLTRHYRGRIDPLSTL